MKKLFYLVGGSLLVVLLILMALLYHPPVTNIALLSTQTNPPATNVALTPAQTEQSGENPDLASTQTIASIAAEEREVRDVVEGFGKKLQYVSLLAPDAAQEIQLQYSGFVSPTLLETWMKHVTEAPGRMVSSPWPDRIEIASLVQEDANNYEVAGDVIEVTGADVLNGGATARMPVRLVVQKEQGHWLIAEYMQER